MKHRLLFSTAFVLYLCSLPAFADKNWCHGLHACPSDSGSYICGDTGRCDFCPDNEYCVDQKRRVALDHAPADALLLYLPRADTTPGVLNPDVTEANLVDTVCKPKWTESIRPHTSYTNQLRKTQWSEWKLPGKPQDYHEDHRVPLCAGGHPSDPRNPWPQPLKGQWRDGDKNKLELSVCRQLCRGDITLEQARAYFLEPDWTKVYVSYFGKE